ncbi:hypothetical protein ACFLY9_02810 [Patescibacteria group bacterium]
MLIGTTALLIIIILAFNTISESEATKEVEASSENILGVSDDRQAKEIVIVYSNNDIEYELKKPSEEEINEANMKYLEKLKRLEEERRQKEEEERKKRIAEVEALSSFLKKYGSPMASHADLILSTCEVYGKDFCKYSLSIAGVESGFGRVCSGFSAWGMIGVKYPSWEVSIPRAQKWLAETYYLKGYNTFERLAMTSYHGGSDEAKQIWVGNLYSFYKKIPI